MSDMPYRQARKSEQFKMKADSGKRIGTSVPYGYMKYPNNSDKWIIDEPTAEIVKRIYKLYLEGKGLSKIANQLTAEGILVPNDYFIMNGRSVTHKAPENPYHWSYKTVINILENSVYRDVIMLIRKRLL